MALLSPGTSSFARLAKGLTLSTAERWGTMDLQPSVLILFQTGVRDDDRVPHFSRVSYARNEPRRAERVPLTA